MRVILLLLVFLPMFLAQRNVPENGVCTTGTFTGKCVSDCSGIGGAMANTQCELGLTCCVLRAGPAIGTPCQSNYAGFEDGTCQTKNKCMIQGKIPEPNSNVNCGAGNTCCVTKMQPKVAEYQYPGVAEAQMKKEAEKRRAELAEEQRRAELMSRSNKVYEAPKEGPFTFNDKPGKPMQTLGNQPVAPKDGPFTFQAGKTAPPQTLGNQPTARQDGPFTYQATKTSPPQTLGNQPEDLSQTICPISPSFLEVGADQSPFAGLTPRQIAYCREQRAKALARKAKVKATSRASPADNAAEIARLKELVAQNRKSIVINRNRLVPKAGKVVKNMMSNIMSKPNNSIKKNIKAAADILSNMKSNFNSNIKSNIKNNIKAAANKFKFNATGKIKSFFSNIRRK